MSQYYYFSGFDDFKYESLECPSKDDLFECLDNSDFLDEETKSQVGDVRIFFAQDREREEGFVDYLILLLQEKGSLTENEKIVIEFLKKISEYHGNLVKECAQEDPYFFGYLSSSEVVKLNENLSNISIEQFENPDDIELLQKVLEGFIAKKSGLIYAVC